MKKATKSQRIAALEADNETLRQTVNRLSLVVAGCVAAARGDGFEKGDALADEPAVKSIREMADIGNARRANQRAYIDQLKQQLTTASDHLKKSDEIMSRAARALKDKDAGILRRSKAIELVQAVINDIQREQPDFQIPRTLDLVLGGLIVANIG